MRYSILKLLLQISLIVLGAVAATCHRMQFRGSRARSNFGNGLSVSPGALESFGDYRFPSEPSSDIDPFSNDPWSPRIVQIEVTHEVLREIKPTVEDGGWVPIIPKTKTVSIWKAPDYKPKDAYYLKPSYDKDAWKSNTIPHSWNHIKKPSKSKLLWAPQVTSPYVYQKPIWTPAPSVAYKEESGEEDEEEEDSSEQHYDSEEHYDYHDKKASVYFS